MSCWFPGGNAAVVAARATPRDHARVIELGAGEGFRSVAGLTTHLRWQVLLRLDHVVARQTQTAGVASGAVAWRPLENTVHMTRLAARCRMRTGQCVASLQVVEVRSTNLCLCA